MIVMNDFKREDKVIGKQIRKVIDQNLKTGWYILGKSTTEFETNFAKYIGTKYAIGVANGLEALQIALLALGVGKGDEVITVSNSAVATALAITNVGAKPVFIDVDEYQHMDVTKIEEKITKKTKAILPVHLFGQSANIGEIKKLAKKHNLFVVEDACQAHGAEFNSKKTGSLTEIGCFSFYPTKNLGAYGDGGAITTNSKELYEKCMMLRNYGQKNRYIHLIKGINSRLDELHAAVLNQKLKGLSKTITMRRSIAALYHKYLADCKDIVLPKERKNAVHAYHLFAIQVKNREELQQYLLSKGIQTIVHYPIPIHKQACYEEFNSLTLKETERLADCIVSLPIHPYMTEKEVKKVSSEVKNFYKKSLKGSK